MFSLITPVHPPHFKFLSEAHETLLEQTIGEWEWIVAPQHETPPLPNDPRIKLHPVAWPNNGTYPPIGLLKRHCADRAIGDVIVEFDADDLLHPECLSELRRAFDDPLVAMAYSNNAGFDDGTWKPRTFIEQAGWKTRPVKYKGKELRETLHFPVGPQALRSVLFSPDHVRAWRRSAYEEVGGHDSSIQNGDDHELMCRFYNRFGAQGIKHIERCLYFYRWHAENTCQKHNADVFSQVDRNYCKYRTGMVTQWAEENGLRKLDLGGRFNAWPGYEVVDIEPDIFVSDKGARGQNVVLADLNCDWSFAEDNSVGVIRASHILEHLHDPIHAMNEAYRVLAPGGWLLAEVPSTDGRGAFQDPTHVTFWNEHSFWYYTDQSFARFIQPKYKGRFQTAHCVTFFAGEFEKAHNIPWVQADLIALKPPYSDHAPGIQLI